MALKAFKSLTEGIPKNVVDRNIVVESFSVVDKSVVVDPQQSRIGKQNYQGPCSRDQIRDADESLQYRFKTADS